ncbi:MAG: hypothetical protein J6B30_05775 [Muribaculaceae bacterium]|nr:hypothetical protein [Muribaculaceae bacterium]
MDIEKFINTFNYSQKVLLNAILLTTPISYAILYYKTQYFDDSEFFAQIIISIAVAIAASFISYIFMRLGIIISGYKIKIRLFQIMIPPILIFLSTFILDFTPLEIIAYYISISTGLAFSYFILFRLVGLKTREIENKKNNRRKKKQYQRSKKHKHYN